MANPPSNRVNTYVRPGRSSAYSLQWLPVALKIKPNSHVPTALTKRSLRSSVTLQHL